MRGGPQAAHDFCSRTEVFILAESLGGGVVVSIRVR
jgi:cystathionine gamma-synthase